MITPSAFHLIIKHFNELDQRLAAKFLSARPWDETALTAMFCDLMDGKMQAQEKIDYGIEALNADLKKDAGLLV